MESTLSKASPADENKQSDTLETPSSAVKDTSSETKKNLSAREDTLLDTQLSELEPPSPINDTRETISSGNDTTSETKEHSSVTKDTLLEVNNSAQEISTSVKDTPTDEKENAPLSNVSLLQVNISALEESSPVEENTSATQDTSKDASMEPKKNTNTSMGELVEVSDSALETPPTFKVASRKTKEYTTTSKDPLCEEKDLVLEMSPIVKDNSFGTKQNTPALKDTLLKVNALAEHVESVESKRCDTKQAASVEDITHNNATFENRDNSYKIASADQSKQHELPEHTCSHDGWNFTSEKTKLDTEASKSSIFTFNACEQKKSSKSKPTTMSSNSRASKIRAQVKASKIRTKEPSNVEQHSCDFCVTSAKFVCRVCSYKYCISCLAQLHPNVGPFQHHYITHIDKEIGAPYLELCPEHGLPEKLNCDFCKCMRCVECASSKCKLHFKVKVSNVDIEKEKAILLSEYEKASAKLSFLGNYREKLEDERLNIELKALLKREKIRQEFASFHEMLILKENAILEKLDKDTCTRLGYIKETLLTQIETFEKEDCQLANSVTDLIQCKEDQHFIEEHVVAKERCRDVDRLIRDFDECWAKHSDYPPSFLLDNPLSMLYEKRQLSDSLDVTLGYGSLLRFKTTILHIKNDQHLDIFEHLQVPHSVPPSTKLEFLVQIYIDGVLQYSKGVSDSKTFRLNTLGTLAFTPGLNYLIKVTAYHTSTGRDFYSKPSGIPTHMLLLCGSQNHQKKRHVCNETERY